MSEQAQLRTARMLLRELSDDDAPAFAAMNADPRVMRHYPALLSRAESDALIARIRRGVEEHGVGLWAVELPGRSPFIGIVGLAYADFAAPFTPCVEVGWRLAREHWGRGYASEASLASLRYGFDDLGLDEILSWTSPANAASRRVMEKIGMTHDPAGDFEHPRVPEGHRLRHHVLYRVSRAAFQSSSGLR